jgi:hypothetical protein
MSKKPSKTKIMEDGLRYQSKVSGSPFASPPSYLAATMSCYLCGTHRVRTSLQSRKFIGKTQLVCSPSCAEAKKQDAEAKLEKGI